MNSTLSNGSGTSSQGPLTTNDVNASGTFSPLKKLNYNAYNHNNHPTGQGITCNSKPVPHVVNPSFKEDLEVSVTWSLVKLSRTLFL